MPEISRTAQVLKYFAQQYQSINRKGIPRLRLVKMAYMSDVLARQFLDGPVTAFNWYRYTYGPYDDAILEAIDELVSAGLASISEEWGHDSPIKRLAGRGAPIVFDFSAAEMEVMKYVADNYMPIDMQELLDGIVYKTVPMAEMIDRNPRDKVLLNMEQINNWGTEQVGGIRLEDVLRAEESIRAGRFVTQLR
jgi:hypothetical protein